MESDQFITAKDLISLGLTYSISSANNMMFRVRKECNIAPYGKVTYQNYLSVFVKPRICKDVRICPICSGSNCGDGICFNPFDEQ